MLIAIVATAAAVAAWIYLLGFRGAFWLTDQRLPPQATMATWPDVTAVIPARDEAAVLPRSLPGLLSQDYPGRLRVILVDDESSDGTAQVAAQVASGVGEVTVVTGTPTPEGWAGKVWAMEQGLGAAGGAEYVLFTDADIAYAPGTVRALVAASGDRVIVSQMALLRTGTGAERLLIPAFVYFFAQLFPFRWVNRARTAAAAGGCMLVRRDALEEAGGLERISDARIDDVALGRLLKGVGSCWLGFTTDVVSLREYTGLGQVWDMVARSAYTQLRYSPMALAGTVLGLIWLYLLPPAAALAGLTTGLATGPAKGFAAGSALLAALGLAGWLIMSVSYLPVLRLCGLSPWRAPALPLIATLYAGMTISSARRHYAGRGGEWKGRVIQTTPAADKST
ncbi:MAG TPA: glycosyltransferase [Streptosporangiaceae bacterium]|nr:glycosyltransferase [Streptosporangiaceae bacterium]